jgi:hypothetical protein
MLAFVDESGDSNLNTSHSNVSTHFIVTAIIIKGENIKIIENQIEEIRKKYFQTGEIRSSKIASNDKRRLKILQAYEEIDINIYSLVVDKEKLTSLGYKYKASFYKNLVGKVYKDISRVHKSLDFSIDAIGTQEFMNAFAEYLNKLHEPDLFGNRVFGFVNSRSDLLIQTADFFAGTIARIFDRKNKSTHASEFLSLMTDKLIDIVEYPYVYKKLDFDFSQLKDNNPFSKQIVEYSIMNVQNYINENENNDDENEILRVDCLKYMLLVFRHNDLNRYIPTQEILRHLNFGRFNNVTVHFFRTEIIARLRDKGLIICSSSNMKGYKFPCSLNDMYEFFNFYNTIITPMINRVSKCNNAVKLLTNKEVNLLNREEYDLIRYAVEGQLLKKGG